MRQIKVWDLLSISDHSDKEVALVLSNKRISASGGGTDCSSQ